MCPITTRFDTMIPEMIPYQISSGAGGFMMLFIESTWQLGVMEALSGLDGSFYGFHFIMEGAQGKLNASKQRIL
mgnify:CR=1 FL=1